MPMIRRPTFNVSSLLSVLLLVLLAAMFAVIVSSRPAPERLQQPLAQEAMHRLGLERSNWETTILFSERIIDAPPEVVYAHWAKLDGWANWPNNPVKNARWVTSATDGAPSWQVGAAFEQTIDLGFPLDHWRSIATIETADAPEKIIYGDDSGSIPERQIWSFRPMPGSDNSTRVIAILVFQSKATGFLRLFREADWQMRYDQMIDSLAVSLRGDITPSSTASLR